jgi:hypothetical protein
MGGEAILSNSLTASKKKKWKCDLNDDVRKLLDWPKVHRNVGFPINDNKQAENLQKQFGQEKRTSKVGRLHRFTIGVTLSEATLKFKGEMCWRNEQSIL